MNQILARQLDIRIKQGNIRTMKAQHTDIDFSSNDYLGFSRSAELRDTIAAAWQAHPTPRCGATGSRLLTGHCQLMDELEHSISTFHNARSGLLFNSGYTANLGLVSTIPKAGDLILYDVDIHASMHDGMRLSGACRLPFRHNDASHLEQRLKARKCHGRTFVLIESVYSCDGSLAPLADMTTLCGQHQANLIVDEAHATGLFGNNGEGLAQHLNLHDKLFARVHTFSKALGGYGAIVLGSNLLKDYLINFCRPFIYATALPFPVLIGIQLAYRMLPHHNHSRAKLHSLIRHFKLRASQAQLPLIPSGTPIQSIPIPGNMRAKATAAFLQGNEYGVRPLLSPTVRRGAERLRVCLHSFNTPHEVDMLIDLLKKFLQKL